VLAKLEHLAIEVDTVKNEIIKAPLPNLRTFELSTKGGFRHKNY
jgi:hypothetical protein